MYQLNVQNDRETLENWISYVQSSSLSQPSFWKYKMLDFLGIKIEKGKSYITYIWATWDDFVLSDKISVGIDNLYSTKLWNWFDIYSWWTLLWNVDTIYLMYKPYNIWSFIFDWSNNKILTWNKTVKFNIIADKLKYYKSCFKFDVVSWRLYNSFCE